MIKACHSEPVRTLAWESGSPRIGERIAEPVTVREPFPELGGSLSKEVPKDMDAMASMSITCLVGLFFLNRLTR